MTSIEEGNFITIPDIVDDLNISPCAIRLYIHLKRVCGDGGECTESIETLAKHLRFSKPTIIKAKRELEGARLISITLEHPNNREWGYHKIQIIK